MGTFAGNPTPAPEGSHADLQSELSTIEANPRWARADSPADRVEHDRLVQRRSEIYQKMYPASQPVQGSDGQLVSVMDPSLKPSSQPGPASKPGTPSPTSTPPAESSVSLTGPTEVPPSPQAEAMLRQEWGDYAFDGKLKAARFMAGEVDRVMGTGKLATLFIETGLGDHPGVAFLMNEVSELLGTADALLAGAIPSDRVERARYVADLLDRRLNGGVRDFVQSAGLDGDPRVLDAFDAIGQLLSGKATVATTNPGAVRAQIEKLTADPAYMDGSHPQHKVVVDRLSTLYALAYGR